MLRSVLRSAVRLSKIAAYRPPQHVSFGLKSNSNFLAQRWATSQPLIQTTRPIRNVAVIAHVDHGKTSLVDRLLQQSGFNDLGERAMDMNDLEKERGITILSKVTSFKYAMDDNEIAFNIVDTPGHADFGGEVERIMSMVDGVLLVVDAKEGPMSQTKFVLGKALEKGLRPVVVLNKADREDARLGEVENEIFDLFVNLDASEEQLEFPILYASAKEGWAAEEADGERQDMGPILRAIHEHVPPPRVAGKPEDPFQMLVTQIDMDQYIGKLALGRVSSGQVKVGDKVTCLTREGEVQEDGVITRMFARSGLQQVDMPTAEAGDIVQVAGLATAEPTDTITIPTHLFAIPADPIDPPTIAMIFGVNDSPLGGREGKMLTSAVIAKRLEKEAITNVALRVQPAASEAGLPEATEVQGRGELQLSVLIENMRREGFELSVSPPRVLFGMEDGKKTEPYEEVIIDVDDVYSGVVIEKMALRKAEMQEYTQHAGKTRLTFIAPSRGLIGYQSDFRTDTRGSGVMNRSVSHYGPFIKELGRNSRGALISSTAGEATAYTLQALEPRGQLFVAPGAEVYEGMVIGEHTRSNDLDVNPVKGKKLTNMRASGSDDKIILAPPRLFTLEEAITYLGPDELLEVTPSILRLRKRFLCPNKRKQLLRSLR